MNVSCLELRRIGLTPRVFAIRGWRAGTIPVGDLSGKTPAQVIVYRLAFALGASAPLPFKVPSHH
jgi:hypothetical protein